MMSRRPPQSESSPRRPRTIEESHEEWPESFGPRDRPIFCCLSAVSRCPLTHRYRSCRRTSPRSVTNWPSPLKAAQDAMAAKNYGRGHGEDQGKPRGLPEKTPYDNWVINTFLLKVYAAKSDMASEVPIIEKPGPKSQ